MTQAVLDQEKWAQLVLRIAPALDASATYEALALAYDESHRAYHSARHIVDCLAQFEGARDLCARPNEAEFALWLHDVVYKTRGGDSELKSAELAAKWLREGGADAAVPKRVYHMILATQHGGPPATDGSGGSSSGEADADLIADTELMLDVDLSILGRDEKAFDEYESNVRAEFRWVPGPMFRSKRAELLEQFLARPRLFATPRFFDRYEAQARANLARSIEMLRGA